MAQQSPALAWCHHQRWLSQCPPQHTPSGSGLLGIPLLMSPRVSGAGPEQLEQQWVPTSP